MFRIATALLVACLASNGARADEAEDKAVKVVKDAGGTVTRDMKRPGQPVVEVKLAHQKLTPATLKSLAAFPRLTDLNLGESSVTVAGMKELAAVKTLTDINLAATDLTDDGLKELTALKNLTSLQLKFSKVTEEGVKAFRKALPKCNVSH